MAFISKKKLVLGSSLYYYENLDLGGNNEKGDNMIRIRDHGI